MIQDIAFILSSEYLVFQVQQQLRALNIQAPIYIVPVELEETLFKANELINQGTRVFISRGRHVDMLRENIEVPVVEIRYSFEEFVMAVSEALTLTSRIALVGYNDHYILPQLKNIFEFDRIEFRKIDQPIRTRAVLKELKELGIECIISGQNIGTIAQELGMHSVRIRVTENNFKNAMRDALYYRRLEVEKHRQFESIASLLDHAQEGILSIDSSGRVISTNSIADRLLHFGSLPEEISIYGVLPEKLIAQILEGVPAYNEVVVTQSEPLLVSGIATQLDDQVKGAVITLQPASDVHQKEYKLRKQMLAKGHVAKNTFDQIIGRSPALQAAKKQAAIFASANASVLIYGETGTGKELFAQSIHNASARRGKPFVAINCAALPESILESELFGYVKGAFTGARPEGKIGIFEQAHTGTIFLDEISEISPAIQARLLRVIQEREITRIGDDRTISIDVRIITSTNRNLQEEIREHKFREDLFYRINVLTLRLPPLRERTGDIEDLVRHYTARFAKASGRQISVSPEAVRSLSALSWPGNVRQLRNFIECAVALAQGRDLTSELVETVLRITGFDMAPDDSAPIRPEPYVQKRKPSDEENEHIRETLRRCGGNKTKAARELGISYATLWRHLKKMDQSV